MSMTNFDKNVNIISSLSDEPNSSDGLTADELKAKFDAAVNLIKDYINNTQNVGIDAELALKSDKTYVDARTSDYIVEQGTSGIWGYRKWADGTAECWGRWSGSLTHYATYLGGYGYTALVALPFTFAAEPIYTYIGKVGSAVGIPASLYGDTSKVQVVLLSNTSGTQSIDANIFVRGRWK